MKCVKTDGPHTQLARKYLKNESNNFECLGQIQYFIQQ